MTSGKDEKDDESVADSQDQGKGIELKDNDDEETTPTRDVKKEVGDKKPNDPSDVAEDKKEEKEDDTEPEVSGKTQGDVDETGAESTSVADTSELHMSEADPEPVESSIAESSTLR